MRFIDRTIHHQQSTDNAPFLKGGKQKFVDDADAVWASDPTPTVSLEG